MTAGDKFLAVNSILTALASLVPSFQLCALLLISLMAERQRLQLASQHISAQYNISPVL